MKIVNLTPENASEHSFFCIKNVKETGFKAKLDWFAKRIQEGLKLKVIYADDGKQIGFIEYIPTEYAWRPIEADNWLFIQCIMVYPNKYRNSGAASILINKAIEDAKNAGKVGVCTMTSKGPWIATKNLFSKAGFKKVEKRGRFELMALKLKEDAPDPMLIDWENQLHDYKGWHLLYADQCPLHDKGVKALIKSANEKGIDLQVRKIETSAEAKQMPSGFGVFTLIHDGKLLEDHYISRTRFETILGKELN